MAEKYFLHKLSNKKFSDNLKGDIVNLLKGCHRSVIRNSSQNLIIIPIVTPK